MILIDTTFLITSDKPTFKPQIVYQRERTVTSLHKKTVIILLLFFYKETTIENKLFLLKKQVYLIHV